MVLRDAYINDTLRSACFFLLLLTGACQQTPTAPRDTTATTTTSAEPAKEVVHNAITDQAQTIRNQLQSVMSEMNAIYRTAQDLQVSGGKGKGEPDDEGAKVALRKSGTVLGAMFILEGSLTAVEQRFNEGMLDQKQAQEMLNKLFIDLESYKGDVKKYREVLGSRAPAKAEKSEKK